MNIFLNYTTAKNTLCKKKTFTNPLVNMNMFVLTKMENKNEKLANLLFLIKAI